MVVQRHEFIRFSRQFTLPTRVIMPNKVNVTSLCCKFSNLIAEHSMLILLRAPIQAVVRFGKSIWKEKYKKLLFNISVLFRGDDCSSKSSRFVANSQVLLNHTSIPQGE